MNTEGGIEEACFPTRKQMSVTENPEGKNTSFGVRPRFRSWLHYFLAVWSL